jgi:mono/diheme cytochrome c family protein
MRALILALVFGCTPDEPEPITPWALDADAAVVSGEFVAQDDALWLADRDRGSVARWSEADGWTETPLDATPHRLAVLGNAVAVTLRTAGDVRLFEVDGALRERWSAHLGGEPTDVTADPALGKLWVTLGTAHEVVELDLLTGEVLQRWSTPGVPRGLVRVPGESGTAALWVTFTSAPRVDRIDLTTGAVDPHPLLERRRFTGPDCHDRPIYRRTSGEARLAEDGAGLYVATLYVDTWLDGPAPGTGPAWQTEDIPTCSEPGSYEEPWRSEYPAVTGRFNPVLYYVHPDDPSLDDPVHVGWTLPARGDAFAGTVRSYPSGLTLLPGDGGRPHAWMTLEASDALLTIDLDDDRPPEEEDGRFSRAGMSGVRTLKGASALAATDAGVWVWTWLDRKLELWPAQAAGGVAADATPLQAVDALPSPLSESIQRGRRHFYTAVKPEITFPGSGVSCSTCHADTRADGLPWKVSHPPYETTPISLAGPVGDAPPLLWTGDAHDVRDEVLRVTSQFTLATAMTTELALDIQAYVNSTPDISPPGVSDPDTAAIVERGRALFNDPVVGCSTCHAGARGKDGLQHQIWQWGPTNTPSLKGLAATAPYLHDASAPTLRDVLQLAVDRQMGDASHLSEDDLDALVEFLKRF